MNRNTSLICSLIFILCLSFGGASFIYGNFPDLSFEDLTKTADLIFIGTVVGRDCVADRSEKMVFTHVHFAEIQVIHARPGSVQARLQTVRLIHPGGRLPDRAVWISAAPRFEPGRRYLVFARDDGKVYANPVVGGSQGQFEVIKDGATAQEYLLTAAGNAVLGVTVEGLRSTHRPVDHIQNGIVYFREPAPAAGLQTFTPVPTPASSGDASSPGLTVPAIVPLESPLPLPSFVDEIKRVAFRNPDEMRSQPPESDGGRFYSEIGGQTAVMDLSDFPKKRPEARDDPAGGISPEVQGESIEIWYDAELFACGYQYLYEVLEQVSSGRWDYDDNENAMAIWNFHMDIFRYAEDDGYYGFDNGEDEICGFLSDGDVYSEYNFHWGGASGMTVNLVDPDDRCDEIQESDIMFNAALTWTDNFTLALGNPANQYYPEVVLHEMGHVWGYMSGGIHPETYAYDHPSVMNGPTSDIVENAMQVHVPDTYLMRRVYDSQTSIPSIQDAGVESYYAANGLHQATTNAADYYPGDSITISNVTVENLSPAALSEVRLRFYLSSDRTITTADYQMGFYWYWTVFAAEGYNYATYATTIPYNVPSGDYYVGAIVTINGFGADDSPSNNATFLYNVKRIHPVPPSNVQASDGAYVDRIRVTWDAVPDAAVSGYRVYRSTSEGGPKTLLGTTSGAFYDDFSPAADLNFYWIKSDSAYGESLFSSFDTGYVLLATPTGLSASDGTYTEKVFLDWNDVVGASAYEVWRNTENLLATASLLQTTGGLSFYDDTSAVPEILYYYWVRAKNFTGVSGFSSGDAGWRALAPPANVSATDGTYADKVRVTWDLVPFAADFEVWRYISDAPFSAVRIASGIVATSYDDTAAVPLQTYFYWVRAMNAFGGSVFSLPDSGYRTLGIPGGVTASDGSYSDKVRLAWGEVSGATSYEIWRNTADESGTAGRIATQDSGHGTSYDDAAASPGRPYYYWVKAKTDGGVSAFSASDRGYRLAAFPEINIRQNAADIPDGTAAVDIGEAYVGKGKTVEFVVENLGAGELQLTGEEIVEIGGSGADAFEVLETPSRSIRETDSSSFLIAFIPEFPGIYDVTVTIPNSDEDENPYDFGLTGAGVSEIVYISGIVKTAENAGIAGVTITFSAGGGVTTTASDGTYSRGVPTNWSGTAAPSKSGYTFSPGSRTYSNLISNQPNQDFTGIPLSLGTYVVVGGHDFDGNGASDVAVFRPGDGTWHVKDGSSLQWGASGDIPAQGNYDFDAATEIAVFRPSDGLWYIAGGETTSWGASGDFPVPRDYNGGGGTNIAVWRPSNGVWYISGIGDVQWGQEGDFPVPGDFDGDGMNEAAVWRPSDGGWYINEIGYFQWGAAGDIPVPADYNGDGTTDLAVFRPVTGMWYIKYMWGGTAAVQWGTAMDIPVPGDYDGNGTTDVAIWRPSDGLWYIYGGGTVQYGMTGDIPLVR